MASFRFPALDSYSYRSNVFSFPAVSGDTPPPDPIEISGAQTGTLAEGVYHVTGDLLVETGTSWTISAGCEFYFMDDYEVYCQGQVQCLGTSSKRITFQLHPEASATQWGGFACATRNELLNGDTAPDEGAEYKWLYCDFEDAKKLASLNAARSLKRGGAIMTYNADYIEIDNCTFDNCEARENGGTIYLQLLNTSTRIISNCTISNSNCISGPGGAIAAAEASYTLTNVSFSNCTAPTYQNISITADSSTDVFDTVGQNFLTVGQPITFNVGGTLPEPIEAGRDYYDIDNSSTTFKVADTYADAVAGTAIDITTNGSGFTGNAHQTYYVFAGTVTIN